MNDFNSLLNSAASYGQPTGDSNRVKDAVRVASELKKNALSNSTPIITNRLTGEQTKVNPADIINAAVGGDTPYGEASATGVERDLRDMDFSQLVQKYGEDAYKLVKPFTEARQGNLITNEMANRKSVTTGIADNLTDVAVGVGSLAKIPAMALGLVSNKAGAIASTFLADLDATAADSQSQARQRTRAQSAVLNELDTRDNKAQYEEDVETKGDFLATLYREGRNALGAVSIDASNPEMLAAGLSQAGGSLLTAAPLAKGIAAVGSKVVPQQLQKSIALSGAIDANMGTLSASRALASVGKNGAFPAAVGLLEGSGAYAEVMSTGMKLPFETLEKESEEYNALIAKGVSPEEAKLQVVSAAAKTALAIQAPLAAATGLLVSKFESNLFKRVSLRQSGGNMGRETLEEGTQGLTGEIAKNLGVQQNLNSEQELFEGTGKATGTGALYGLGISGVVQTPTLAGNVLNNGVKAGANALLARANKVTEANEAASPVSPVNLQTAGAAAAASVAGVSASIDAVIQDPASTLSDEDKTNLAARTAEITAAYGVDENEFNGGPPEIVNAVKDAKGIYEVIAGLAKVIESTLEGTPAHNIASYFVYEKIKKIEDFLGKNQDFLNALPEGDPARNAIAEFQTFGANLMQSKVVVNSIAKVTASLVNQQNTGKTVVITDENASTPEAQQSANETATLAALAPDKVNPEAVRNVLFHASKGSINITPAQEAALQVASAVLKNTVPLPDDMNALSAIDTVSLEAVNAEDVGNSSGSKGYSAVQHASRIANAVRLGNIAEATEMLKSFGMFAQHTKNRSRALLESLNKVDPITENGPKIKFKQLVRGVWQDQNFNGFRAKGNGTKFAAQVAKEAEGIIGLYNDLAKLFPELNSKEIKKNAEDIFLGSFGEVVEKITKRVAGTYVPPATTAASTNISAKSDTQTTNAEKAKNTENLAKQRIEALGTYSEKQLENILAWGEKRLNQLAEMSEQADKTDIALNDSIDKAIVVVTSLISKTKVALDKFKNYNTNTVNVYFSAGENASLSNLASRPFSLGTGVNGEVFDPNDVDFNLKVNKFLSVEHAYQSLKSGKFDQATYDKYTVAGVKIAGNKGTDKANSIALMEVLIGASFAQNPEAKKALLATGDAAITHTQDKSIWAKEFPRILMELREKYKNNQTKVIEVTREKLTKLIGNTIFKISEKISGFFTLTSAKNNLFGNPKYKSAIVTTGRDNNVHNALWFGPVAYEYSGRKHPAIPVTDELAQLGNEIAAKLGLPKGFFNSVHINRYTNNKGLGAHADDEFIFKDAQGSIGPIATYSLGSSADITIKHAKTGKLVDTIRTTSGSIYVMPDTLDGFGFQQTYKHAVGPSNGERISFTFRHVPPNQIQKAPTASEPVVKIVEVVAASDSANDSTDADPMQAEARAFVTSNDRANPKALSKHLNINYNRAARMLENMESDGYLSSVANDGSRTLIKAAPEVKSNEVNKTPDTLINKAKKRAKAITKIISKAKKANVNFADVLEYIAAEGGIQDSRTPKQIKAGVAGIRNDITYTTNNGNVRYGIKFLFTKNGTPADKLESLIVDSGYLTSEQFAAIPNIVDWLAAAYQNPVYTPKAIIEMAEQEQRAAEEADREQYQNDKAQALYDALLSLRETDSDGNVLPLTLNGTSFSEASQQELFDEQDAETQAEILVLLAILASENAGTNTDYNADNATDQLLALVLGIDVTPTGVENEIQRRSEKGNTGTAVARAEAPTRPKKSSNVSPVTSETSDDKTPENKVNGIDVVVRGLGRGLLNAGFNYLVRGFKIAAEGKGSNLIRDMEVEGFSTLDTFTEISGEFVKNNSKATALLAQYNTNITALSKLLYVQLNTALQEYLKKSEGKSYENIVNSVDKIENNQQHMMSGRLLNFTVPITTKNGKETLEFDRNYLISAALATQQWLLEINDLIPTTNLDGRAAKLFGVAETDVTAAQIGAIRSVVSRLELVNSLATKLEKYWGIVPKKDQPDGFNVALSKAYASQIINALELSGKNSEYLLPNNLATSNGGEITAYVLSSKIKENLKPLQADPQLLDRIVLQEVEETTYVGEEAKVPVSQNVLRNKSVPLQQPLKTGLDNEQKTPHFIDIPMTDLYQAFGLKNLKKLFNIGWQGDPDNQHIEHRISTEGSDRGFTAAYDKIIDLLARVEYTADGKPLNKVPVFYKYEIISTGRMNMMGSHNPQSNKPMRHAVMPTQSEGDATIGTEFHEGLMLGIGQQIGLKVHNQDISVTMAEVTAYMEEGGAFFGIVNELRDWLSEETDRRAFSEVMDASMVERILAAHKVAGKESTPMSLYAVLEYAKYKQAAKEGLLKTYNTNMYVEADGVSNGPIAALYMLSNALNVTPKWLENMRRGGLFFGSKIISLNDYRSKPENKADLYKKTADVLSDILNKMYKMDKVNDFAKHIRVLTDTFTDGMSTGKNADGTDSSVIERGMTKNPLTITVYGSSTQGIAGKLSKEILDNYYESISKGLRIQAEKGIELGAARAIALFGNSSEASINKVVAIDNAFNFLTYNKLSRGEWGFYFNKKADFPKNTWSGDTIKQRVITPKAKTIFIDNINILVAEPMSLAIKSEMNSDGALDGAALIKETTQIKSIYLKYAYIAAYNAYFKEKKDGSTRKKTDGLSVLEVEGIAAELRKVFPLVTVGYQSFDIVGRESFNEGNDAIGEDLSGKKVTTTNFGPGGSSSRGVPYLVIGLGDGQMMQILAGDPNGPEGSLKIFDGMHMKLSTLKGDSIQANKAVWESWNTDPFGGLATSFKYFYENYIKDIKYVNADFEMYTELGKALNANGFALNTNSFYNLNNHIFNRVNDLHNASLRTQARQEVLSSYEATVDQMAAVGASYINPGKPGNSVVDENGNDKSDEVLAAEMSVKIEARYKEFLAKNPPIATNRTEDQIARSTKSTIEELLNALVDFTNKSANKKAESDRLKVIKIIKESKILNDYTVEYVSVKELQELAGITDPTQIINGMLDANGRVIYLTATAATLTGKEKDRNTEIALHEVIHAATIQILTLHYASKLEELDIVNKTNIAPAVADAVANLERLMNTFTAKYANNTDPAVLSLLAEMAKQDLAQNSVAKLNEFMAWSLTNNDLINKGKVTVDTGFANYAKQVIKNIAAIIKSIFNVNSNKQEEITASNVFQGVLFNTAVLVSASSAETENINTNSFTDNLHHSPGFGTDFRLSAIAKSFENQVIRYLKANINPAFANSTAPLTPNQTTVSGVYLRATGLAAQAVTRVSSQFAMTPQESTTLGAIVAALATGAAVDGNSMAKVQELYNHVLKNLKASDFLADPNSNDPNALFMAQGKYDIVAGNLKNQIDSAGKTTILPIFLGLSIVNEEFRNILSKIKLPEKDKNNWSSTDSALESIGNNLMENLENTLTNNSNKKANVQEALNALTQRIIAIEQDRKNVVERTSAKTGTYVDVVNDKVVDLVQRNIDKASKKLGNIRKNTNSKILKNTAAIAELTLGIVSEKNSSILAEGVTSAMNASGFNRTFADIVSDIIGRIDSNSSIYDMIKITRSVVSQNRQMYREKLPTVIASQFNGNLALKHWKAQFVGIGKTDLAALVGKFTVSQIVDLMENPSSVTVEIAKLEASLKAASPREWTFTQFKSKQLAEWMNTGKVGTNLLRNAEAISQQAGSIALNKKIQPESYVKDVDQLISLYAFKTLAPNIKQDLSFLVQTERQGIEFVLSYLSGQRKGDLEIIKNNPITKFNHYKGYIPSDPKEGISLIVANDSDYVSLVEKSYTRVGDYKGDTAGPKTGSRGYYTSKVAARSLFSQGLIQNVHQSAGGVSTLTGLTNSLTAGVISGKGQVALIKSNLINNKNQVSKENLMPIFDSTGATVAYERSVDPVQMEYLESDTHIAKMIGVWRGRQVEEAQAHEVNKILVQRLFDKYTEEIGTKPKEYVDLFSPTFLKTDPVLADAMRLMPVALREEIKRVYGGNRFMVRADMLKDVVGYRTPSVGDAWTRTSRWSPEVLDGAKKIAISVFGNKAYEYFVNSEKILKNFVSDARVIIVVKSVIVPVGNLVSNVLQLVAKGVPITTIMKEMPKKLNEINTYVKSRNDKIDLEAKLKVAQGNNDIVSITKLTTAMQVIDDMHKSLSIWPLIEAGEFSAIADAGIAREEIILSEGRLNDFIENLTSKLPTGIRTLGKYALVTKDTALFQGLQKSMEYGDFLGKAVRYDDLRSRGKMNQQDALAGITEEFVNYDVLPGRMREGLEDTGLLWFYSYKLRVLKTAASIIRKNPVTALVSYLIPVPTELGVGGPMQDNVVSKALEGNLGYSVGLGQGFSAIGLNPVVNLTN